MQAVGIGAECIQDQQGRSLCQLSSGMAEGSSQALEPLAVPEGTKLASWLGAIDAVVVMESTLPNVFALAHKSGVRSKIIFLNLEWSDPHQVSWPASPRPSSLPLSDHPPSDHPPGPSWQLSELGKSIPGLLLAVKGGAAMQLLSAELDKLGSQIKLHLVPWSISDPVAPRPSIAHNKPSNALVLTCLCAGGFPSRFPIK